MSDQFMRFLFLFLWCGVCVAFAQKGGVLVEKWRYLESADVRELYQGPLYFEKPYFREVVTTMDYRDLKNKEGVRMRGYLLAPVSGGYRFWLGARDGADFWLSSDEKAFRKRRLIRMGVDFGTQRGTLADDELRWDRFSEQASEEVFLEKGRRYYFEICHQAAVDRGLHLSLAWAVPGRVRELVPISAVKAYQLSKKDRDDDLLPDAWERDHGLKTDDNGRKNVHYQGERGDADEDGLTNREELQYGTHPLKRDSDGDGIDDFSEIHAYQSDPTRRDAPQEKSLYEVDLVSAVDGHGFLWEMTEEGLVSEEFCGAVSWDFETESNDYYAINVSMKLLGQRFSNEEMEIEIAYDGKVVMETELTFPANGEALLRVPLRYLAAGRHRLTLDFLNSFSYRKVALRKMSVLRVDEEKGEGGDFPAWLRSHLKVREEFQEPGKFSVVSPAFFEGTGYGLIRLNGRPVLPGSQQNHWYANLALKEAGKTSFRLDHEPGLVRSGEVEWKATNIFDEGTLVIRKNDSLKLVATPKKGQSDEVITVTVPSELNWSTEVKGTPRQSSDRPGFPASKAVDDYRRGSLRALSFSQTADGASEAWWEVAFDEAQWISSTRLWNVVEKRYRLTDFRISVYGVNDEVVASKIFHADGGYVRHWMLWDLKKLVKGKRVRVERLGPDRDGEMILALAEVEVFGSEERALKADGSYLIHEFTRAGTFILTARRASGEVAELKVIVKQADFDETTREVLRGTVVDFSLPEVRISSDLFYDAGEGFPLREYQKQEGVKKRSMLSGFVQKYGEGRLLARLGKGGPVVGWKSYRVIDIPDVFRSHRCGGGESLRYPGFQLQKIPIVMRGLTKYNRVDVRYRNPALTFPDGSQIFSLREQELSHDLGFIHALFPVEFDDKINLEFKVYNSDGHFIGRK